MEGGGEWGGGGGGLDLACFLLRKTSTFFNFFLLDFIYTGGALVHSIFHCLPSAQYML